MCFLLNVKATIEDAEKNSVKKNILMKEKITCSNKDI